MARVLLDVQDPTNRLTLKAILEAQGHQIAIGEADVAIADDAARAVAYARRMPSLVLAQAGEIRDAVAAMREGVFGYVFVPFQPGEADLMVERALDASPARPSRGDHPPDALTMADA